MIIIARRLKCQPQYLTDIYGITAAQTVKVINRKGNPKRCIKHDVVCFVSKFTFSFFFLNLTNLTNLEFGLEPVYSHGSRLVFLHFSAQK